MSKSNSGHFSGTSGARNFQKLTKTLSKQGAAKLFSRPGHVSITSIRNAREVLMGKNVHQIERMLQEQGYQTHVRGSKLKKSAAMIIEIKNADKTKNISQVQVSPGSRRHGNIPYVKISTTDTGIIKVIDGRRAEYKTDGKEKAKLIFHRNKRRTSS
jgi:hypothetical protein